MRCGLTTPPFMQVLPIKRPNNCDIRARYCEALCAARMTQFLYLIDRSFRFGVPGIAGSCARASYTSWCGDTRGLCAQQWFGWAMNVHGCRSSGAVVCCGLIHQHRCGHPLPIAVPCALVVAEPWVWLMQDERQGETRSDAPNSGPTGRGSWWLRQWQNYVTTPRSCSARSTLPWSTR